VSFVCVSHPSDDRDPGSSTASFETILHDFLPLVQGVARKLTSFVPPHVEFDDLVSWGVQGLLEAHQRYRADRGASFGTYARFRVRGAILDNLRRQDHFSRAARKKLDRARASLEMTLRRQPREEEMAAALRVDLPALRTMAMEANHEVVSIEDVAATHGESGDVNDHMLDHDSDPLLALLVQERRALVVAALRRLPDRERTAMLLYYSADLRMREIALALGLSEARVSQLHAQAKERLRALLARDFAS